MSFDIVKPIKNEKDMGLCFGSNLFQFEVVYLIKHEWAQTAEDVLWRRTNMGLRLSPLETEAFQTWMTDQRNQVLLDDTETSMQLD